MGQKRTHFLLPIAMLGIASLFYLYEFLLRVAPSVMFAELMQDFDLDARKFGLLSSCYYWSYALLQIPIGMLTDKYGPRRLLTFAIFLCGISTYAFAVTTSFYMACFLRFCIGAGSAFAFICCMKIIATWFRLSLFPLLTGLTLTIGTLGAVASGPVSYLLNYMSWKTLFHVLGYIGMIMALFAWVLIKDRNPHPVDGVETNPEPSSLSCLECVKNVVMSPQNWLVAFYAFLVTAPSDAFGGLWGVSYLVHSFGISREAAAIAVSMTFLGLACGSPFMGWLTGVWQSRRKPMMLSSFLALATLLVLVYAPQLNAVLAGMLFFGFGFWGIYVLSFVVIRDINPSQYVATAVGFVNMLSMLGSGILTFSVGALLDWGRVHETQGGELIYTPSDYHSSLILVPCFYAISAFLVVPFIRETFQRKNIP